MDSNQSLEDFASSREVRVGAWVDTLPDDVFNQAWDALSKAGAAGKKPLNMKYFGGLKSGDANVAENLALWDKGMGKMSKGFDKGNVHEHTPWWKKKWNIWRHKKSGGPINAYYHVHANPLSENDDHAHYRTTDI